MNLTCLLTPPHKKDLNKDSIEETIFVEARKKEIKYTEIKDKNDFSRTSRPSMDIFLLFPLESFFRILSTIHLYFLNQYCKSTP
jgi:hypothetical protein